MSIYYSLKNKQVVPGTREEFAVGCNNRKAAGWIVAQDTCNAQELFVSTVFLGLDHQYGDGPPLVFETMVFPKGKWGELCCDRYSTWEEAEEGHKNMLLKWDKASAHSN